MASQSPSPPPHHHPHHLSSLIVRPSDSGGGGAGGGGSDYEPGEVRPEPPPPPPPPYSRSERFHDNSGHRSDRFNDNSVNQAQLKCKPFAKVEVDRLNMWYGFKNRVALKGVPNTYAYRGSPSLDSQFLGCAIKLFDTRCRDRTGVGRGMRARSGSPSYHRKVENFYRSDFDFDNSGGSYDARGTRGGRGPGRFRDSSPPFDQGTRGGRVPGSFRDSSPPYSQGRGGGSRSFARGTDRFGFDPEPLRSEGMIRNNPNVPRREGDWICPDSLCANLNFARRDYCNKCHRPRPGFDSIGRRDYPGPPRFSGPPIDRSPVRGLNGYRSPPPRSWGRGGPREFDAGPPEPRHGGRFVDHHMPRERLHNREEEYRGRGKVDRERDFSQSEWEPRGRGRGNFLNDRRFDARSERRPISPSPPPPPPVPPRDRWARDIRQRSRSPVRGGPPLKDYRRDSYLDRGREGRFNMARGQGRGRMDNHRPY
ncbi:hypothetical protein GIB67_025260 [Kingdonia uniflora]|uniref:RanBP2-type domain-containing protein n=1 Tax=Kingdonia uniflora TaxID=39325 RepID=A0A7J7NBK5_9MAGN|nr:hypothetical protein GIB67_025260 [Kingdonia uniflora]